MKDLSQKRFSIVNDFRPYLFFSVHELVEHELARLPILWCREGEFRLIPIAVVMNAISIGETYANTPDTTTNPEIHIMWSQGIPISNQAGRALVGE